MNFKFFNILTVSLAALGLLAPIEKAYQTVDHQMNIEEVHYLLCIKEAQYLRCNVEKSKERNKEWAQNQAVKSQGTVSL